MNTKHRRKDRRVLRSASEWQDLIEAYKQSGQTQADFCRERGLDPTTFNGWLRGRTGPGKRKKTPKVSFAQVEMPMRSTPEVEIELPGEVRVRIRNGGSPAALAELIREVARCSTSPER